jgi:DNA-binding XRE family transcriptional regulator
MLVTPSQIKAARAMLDWSAEDLGKRVGVVKTTISAIETGRSNGSVEVLNAIVAVLEAAGIEFQADGGLRPRKSHVLTFEGQSGFSAFREDILSEAKIAPLDVCVSNVDERQFDKWGEGRVNEDYFSEMKKNKPKQFRILVKENDFHLSGPDYVSYRWLPVESFGEISFFVYAQKTAIISFEDNNFQAFVITHPKITSFYRKDFETMWAQASDLKRSIA